MFGHHPQLQEQHFTIGQLDMRGKMNKSGDAHALPPQARSGKRFRRRPDLSDWYDVTLTGKNVSAQFTAAGGTGTYNVPDGIDTLTVTLYGAGGGGGGAQSTGKGAYRGGGGDAGGKLVVTLGELQGRSTLTYFLGSGGSGGDALDADGGAGGRSWIHYDGVTYEAQGGSGGDASDNDNTGAGPGYGVVQGSGGFPITATWGETGAARRGTVTTGTIAGTGPDGGGNMYGWGGTGSSSSITQTSTNGSDGRVEFS